MYIILFGILGFLATFGLVEIIRFSYCEWRKNFIPYYVVIPVKNNQDEIECIIRNTMLNTGSSEIVVVDMGSDDNTLDILLHLKDKYTSIQIYTCDQYIDFLTNICVK